MADSSRLYNSSGVPDLSGLPDMFHPTERPRLNSRSYVSYTLVKVKFI